MVLAPVQQDPMTSQVVEEFSWFHTSPLDFVCSMHLKIGNKMKKNVPSNCQLEILTQTFDWND